MNDLTQYDELRARVRAAFSYHVETWEMMHPPPQPEAANISRLDLIVAFSLVVLVLASVIVSGSRTIAEFGAFIGGNAGVLVGVSAFVMLEIALVVYAFFDTKKSGVHSDRYVIRMTRFGIGLAFVVSVLANGHAIFKAQGAFVSPVIDGIILLFVAVSAPTLALISGHILGSEVVSILNRKSEIARRYRAAMDEWETAKLRSWDAQKAKLGIRVEVVSEAPVSLVSNVRNDKPDRLTPSQQKVWNYLEMNPLSASLTVRELEEAIGVNRDTVSKMLNTWKSSRPQNGSEESAEV